jgi:micrococcal nuclease
MLLLLSILAVAALAFLGDRPVSHGSPAGEPAETGMVAVTRVTDGDTIHVVYRGRDEPVRLIGVDTPEVSWYGGRAGCFGAQAGRYTRGRLSGRTVRLAFDVDLRDRYGRLLAYVYVGSELFNLTLVRLGYATADRVPPDTRMAGTFAAAEDDARSADRGLWAACSYPRAGAASSEGVRTPSSGSRSSATTIASSLPEASASRSEESRRQAIHPRSPRGGS